MSAAKFYHCSKCKAGFHKLWKLNQHHATHHASTYGTTRNNLAKRAKSATHRVPRGPQRDAGTSLPTIPTPGRPKAEPTSINYCPNCGHTLKRYR